MFCEETWMQNFQQLKMADFFGQVRFSSEYPKKKNSQVLSEKFWGILSSSRTWMVYSKSQSIFLSPNYSTIYQTNKMKKIDFDTCENWKKKQNKKWKKKQ